MIEPGLVEMTKKRKLSIVNREGQSSVSTGYLVETNRGYSSCELRDNALQEALDLVFTTHRYAIVSYLKVSDLLVVSGALHFDLLEDARKFATTIDADGNRSDAAIYDVMRKHYTQL